MSSIKWQNEMKIFQNIKNIFIIENNIFDIYKRNRDNVTIYINLEQYIYEHLTEHKYESIIFYNHIEGFYNNFSSEHLETFKSLFEDDDTMTEYLNTNQFRVSIENSIDFISKSYKQRKKSSSIVLNFASRYQNSPENLSDEEKNFYSNIQMLSLKQIQIKLKNNEIINNNIFIIVEKLNDVPAWLYLNNPFVKVINIPFPDKEIQKDFLKNNFNNFYESNNFTENEIESYIKEMLNYLQEFKLLELNNLKNLARKEKISIKNIKNAIELYKFGIKENPWNEIEDDIKNNVEELLSLRVKGQPKAIKKVSDIIKRSIYGLSGVYHSETKPKGVLFLSGPTGTGKTELAKTIAEMIFGDENKILRFDMSEYQQSHSDQKLLGPPPGYIGYETGGKLTNSVRENPFSVILFDEIEKSHPSIMDKFLQILEDGRMTDGKGETVYFTESFIIFTSNLGVISRENNKISSNVNISMKYEDIENKINEEIKKYFKYELKRPEIYNRFGENFIVFDFIREKEIPNIIKKILDKVQINFDKRNIQIKYKKNVLDYIYKLSLSNIENGGRGIGNVIENVYINPFSRFLIDNKIISNCVITIEELYEDNEGNQIICGITNNE